VTDAAGRPAAGAIVMVVAGTAPTPEIGIVTDREGRFRVALPEGRFRLEAHVGGTKGAAEVEVAESLPDIAISLGER
jgi:hypothetical protein